MWKIKDQPCVSRLAGLERMWIAPRQTSAAALVFAADGATVEDPKISTWLEVKFINAEFSEEGRFEDGDWGYAQSLNLDLAPGRNGRETALYLSRLGEACRWHVLMQNKTGELYLAGVTDGFSASKHAFTMMRAAGEVNSLVFQATDRFPSYPVRIGYGQYGMDILEPIMPTGDGDTGKLGSGNGSGVFWDPFRRLGDYYGWEPNEE